MKQLIGFLSSSLDENTLKKLVITIKQAPNYIKKTTADSKNKPNVTVAAAVPV